MEPPASAVEASDGTWVELLPNGSSRLYAKNADGSWKSRPKERPAEEKIPPAQCGSTGASTKLLANTKKEADEAKATTQAANKGPDLPPPGGGGRATGTAAVMP